MTATITDDLIGLQERRRQLSDRLDELKSAAVDILNDVASCEQDFLDAAELGDDVELLSGRVELRKRQLSDNRKVGDHLASLLADLDAQVADIEARQRLADEVQEYHARRIDYSTETLPGLPDALPAAVEIISDALDGLLAEVDGARATHDRLASTAVQLRQRGEYLGVAVDVPEPENWSAGLEREHGKESLHRQLMLACLQQRGAHAILSEIERVINIGLNDRRRSAR
jgi:chromosome segregation ATPase